MNNNNDNNKSRIVLLLSLLTIIVGLPSAFIAYKQILVNKQQVRLSVIDNNREDGYLVLPRYLDTILVVYNINDSLFDNSNINGYNLPFPFLIYNPKNTYIHDLSISVVCSKESNLSLFSSKNTEIIKPTFSDTVFNISTLRDIPYLLELNNRVDRTDNQKIQSFSYNINVSQDNFPSKTISVLNALFYNSKNVNSREKLIEKINNDKLNISNYDIIFFDCSTSQRSNDSTDYVSCVINNTWHHFFFSFFLGERTFTNSNKELPKIVYVLTFIVLFCSILIAIQLFILIDLRKKYSHLSLEEYVDLYDDFILRFHLKNKKRSLESVLWIYLNFILGEIFPLTFLAIWLLITS